MEYTAFYRKFRPKLFSEVIGQDHIVTTIRNQVVAGRVGHAYLFTGSRGCGKTSTAKILSRAVNCLNPKDGEPCNECEICKANLEGTLTDVVEMDAASNNGVDNIRAIRDEVNFLPTVAKYRIYIIDEVHMLSTGAFNALLKTLEEPPAHVKFILATTEPQKLPATILSRCQRFDFKKVSSENIVKNLKMICDESNIKYSEDSLKLIAELSEGAVRDALSILERCAQDGEDNITEDKIKELVGIPQKEFIASIIEKLIKRQTEELLLETEKIVNEGKDVNNLLWEMIKYLKDLLLFKTTNSISNTYSENDVAKMKEFTQVIEKDEILFLIYELSKLQGDIRNSSQTNIVFQVGLLKLCMKETGDVESRINKIEEKLASGNFKKVKQAANEQNDIKVSTDNDKKVEKKTVIKAKSTNFWDNVINTLKEESKPILYTSLNNTKAVMINDMTVGIQFNDGLKDFQRKIFDKHENLGEIKKLVSLECGKDMNIKLIENDVDVKIEDSESKLNSLGLNVNIIN